MSPAGTDEESRMLPKGGISNVYNMGSKFDQLSQKLNHDQNSQRRNIYGAVVKGPVNMIDEIYGKTKDQTDLFGNYYGKIINNPA